MRQIHGNGHVESKRTEARDFGWAMKQTEDPLAKPLLHARHGWVRLTADGQVRNCLFANTETDLRTPLREGASDEVLADLVRACITAKLPGHGINDPGFLQPGRPMSAIGG